MSELLSLLSDGGGGGGVGGGERGGVVDTVEPVGVKMGFWSTELMLPLVVNYWHRTVDCCGCVLSMFHCHYHSVCTGHLL